MYPDLYWWGYSDTSGFLQKDFYPELYGWWRFLITRYHESDHKTHSSTEEHSPEQMLDDVSSLLCDVLEAMNGGPVIVAQNWGLVIICYCILFQNVVVPCLYNLDIAHLFCSYCIILIKWLWPLISKLKLGLIITLRFPQCVVASNELLIEIRIIILPPFVQLMSLHKEFIKDLNN